MSTATLLICSAWLRNVDVSARAVRRGSPQLSLAGRAGASLRTSKSFVACGLAQSDEPIRGRAGEAPDVSRFDALQSSNVPREAGLASGQSPLTHRRPAPGLGSNRLKPTARLLAIGLCIACSAPSQAQEVAAGGLELPPAVVTAPASEPPASPSRTIGGSGPGPCVQVDIAGHRAGHLECASQELEAAARVARREADAVRNISVPEAGSPDVQVGVASRAGARLRLRENFGKSVRPPAVPPPVFTTPGARQP